MATDPLLVCAPQAAGVRPREDVPLAPLTTFRVGGQARYFWEASDDIGVLASLAWARQRNVPVTILGGGSNVLVSDAGVPGLVVRVRPQGVRPLGEVGDEVHLQVGAGEAFDAVVRQSIRAGWAGLECLSGIPGCVGATPIQNVGAYGQEVAETIRGIRAVDITSGAVVTLTPAGCRFGYRSSAFKEEWRGRYVVLAVTFGFRPGGAPTVRYTQVGEALLTLGYAQPTLTAVRAAVLSIRRTKSMLVNPRDPNARSAGSFFTNPIVDADALAGIHASLSRRGGEALPAAMPSCRLPDGRLKLSAGWLIEQAGFTRGMTEGPVGLSSYHALAIVNRGGATAAHILAFARRIHRVVFDTFGLTLAPEPALLGFSDEELGALKSAG
jgi:UDP-N-acetylmuramate dehydrogenase